MKKFTLLAVAFASMFTVSAQSLTLQSMAKLRQHTLESNQPHAVAKVRGRAKAVQAETQATTTLAFVKLNHGYTVSDLAAAGVTVRSSRGTIAIVEVAYSDVEAVSALPCVRTMALQQEVKAHTDRAREAMGVEKIHTGNKEAGLTKSYTGRGVVTGIIDQGIDPHHINFRYSDDPESFRIEYLTFMRLNNSGTGIDDYHYNYTNLGNFTTDDSYNYHGTHTMGIMAGGYNGPVKVAKQKVNASDPTEIVEENCKFYGMAPASTIAAGCGDLIDAIIAAEVEALLDYRYYMQSPMVINLSLGSTGGSKDGSNLMCQYLAEAGKEAIICIAAGNEGDLKIALKKTLTEEDQTIQTLIYPYYKQYDPADPNSYTLRQGAISIYSNDDTPFELKAVIYNKSRNWAIAKNLKVQADNIGTYYISDSNYQMTDSDILFDSTMSKAFKSGWIGIGAKIDEDSGRYYGMVDYAVLNADTNLDDTYVLGFVVEGKPGQTIECYCDGSTTWMDNYGSDKFDDGSCDGSISDLAVGDNVLCVGSYNTRQSWVCLDGGVSSYPGDGYVEGGISGFSSFGTMPDGRILPHVCAPGSAIISSISTPYINANIEAGATDEYLDIMLQAKMEESHRMNYWKQEMGTSMATPAVSGSIALWLEANPNLTIDDVKAIVAKTAVRDEAVNNTREQARWGAGKFDALAGLKEAIRLAAGIDNVETSGHNDRLILTREDSDVYRAFVGGQQSMDARVFTLTGAEVFKASCAGDEITLDLSGLESGVYILNVNGRHSEKIMLGN